MARKRITIDHDIWTKCVKFVADQQPVEMQEAFRQFDSTVFKMAAPLQVGRELMSQKARATEIADIG